MSNPTTELRKLFVENCAAYVGMRELDGRNHAPFIDRFCEHAGLHNPQPPRQGYAYCALGLRYNFDLACKELKIAIPFHISPSVPQIVADAKAHNRWFTDPKLAQIGDLIIWRTLQPTGKYQSHHVEVLTGERMDGMLRTIGFNTSAGDGSINEGGGVYRRWRSWHWFVNAAHIN